MRGSVRSSGGRRDGRSALSSMECRFSRLQSCARALCVRFKCRERCCKDACNGMVTGTDMGQGLVHSRRHGRPILPACRAPGSGCRPVAIPTSRIWLLCHAGRQALKDSRLADIGARLEEARYHSTVDARCRGRMRERAMRWLSPGTWEDAQRSLYRLEGLHSLMPTRLNEIGKNFWPQSRPGESWPGSSSCRSAPDTVHAPKGPTP
jgi:hypothetical protein